MTYHHVHSYSFEIEPVTGVVLFLCALVFAIGLEGFGKGIGGCCKEKETE